MAHYKHYLKVTVRDLSRVSGRCEETVRRHIKTGKVNPLSLESIYKWLGGQRRERCWRCMPSSIVVDLADKK